MVTRKYLTMHFNAPPRPLSSTCVVFQAKPLIAANKEVRSLAVPARQCARWCTPVGLPIGSGVVTARVPGFGVLLRRKAILERFPPPERKSTCAARDDPAQRCREDARRGRQGEERRRLGRRPPAHRQGALTRTVGCAGVTPRSPGVLRTPEYSITPWSALAALASTLEHCSVHWGSPYHRTHAYEKIVRRRRP